MVEKTKRPNWGEYFMKMAFLVAERSTCLHHHIGAVIVRDKRVLTTGYNGPAAGEKHCADLGYCLKEKMAEERGEVAVTGKGVDDCPAIHAELNAIYQASLIGTSLGDSILYATHQPCYRCAGGIAQVGIIEVQYVLPYPGDMRGLDLFARHGIKCNQIEIPNLKINVLE